MTNFDNLVKEFTGAVEEMRTKHPIGTYHWTLNVDDNGKKWAIVLGWADGYEEDEEDDCMDGTYRLCAKLAYQPVNSMMQCDYDIDWLIPYDEETGEVDDTEVSIYPNDNLEEIICWLLKCYLPYYVEDEGE